VRVRTQLPAAPIIMDRATGTVAGSRRGHNWRQAAHGRHEGRQPADIDYAVEKQFISVQRGLNLKGATIADAIADSVDPYFVGMSGRKDNVLAFLDSIGCPPGNPSRRAR